MLSESETPLMRATVHNGIRYLKTNFDELAILSTLAKVANSTQPTLTPEDEAVLLAFQRSTPELADAGVSDMTAYLNEYDPDSIPGIVSNVKGILHEMKYVELENTDGDSVRAALFPDTNHEGYDIELTNSLEGDAWQAQLKATDSVPYVQDWIEDHPDGEIIVTSEIAEKLDIPTSGISNDEVTCQVETFVDRIQELPDDDSIWDMIPYLSLASISIMVFELFKRYRNNRISLGEFKRQAARVTGIKLSKMALIAMLLSIPVVNVVTGAVLVAKLILAADRLLGSRADSRTKQTCKRLDGTAVA